MRSLWDHRQTLHKQPTGSHDSHLHAQCVCVIGLCKRELRTPSSVENKGPVAKNATFPKVFPRQ